MSNCLSEIAKTVQLDMLISNVSGCEDIAAMVVDEFLLHSGTQLADLRSAIEAGDCAGIRDTAHRYKGSLAAIYAIPAQEVAKTIEHAGQTRDASRASELLPALTERSKELVLCLKRWRAEQP